jgi:hypothetical protein
MLRGPLCQSHGKAAICFSQRLLVLAVGVLQLQVHLTCQERDLEDALSWDSFWGGLLSICPGKERCAGGIDSVWFLMVLLSFPKLTSHILYEYSVLKQMTNFRYT